MRAVFYIIVKKLGNVKFPEIEKMLYSDISYSIGNTSVYLSCHINYNLSFQFLCVGLSCYNSIVRAVTHKPSIHENSCF